MIFKRSPKWLAPLFLSLVASMAMAESAQRNVLVLHSYHQGLPWTDAISNGIKNTFKGTEKKYALHFDFLDSKRNTTPEYLEQLRILYANKSQQIDYDLMIVSDNYALQFYLQNKTFFRKELPVVFCGINNYKPEMLEGAQNITGVVERPEFEENIRLMLRLHPQTKRIVVVNDKTSTGQLVKKSLLAVIPQFKDQVAFSFLEKFNSVASAAELESLGPDDLILLLTMSIDSEGQNISLDESMGFIRKHTAIPVYGVWDFQLGHGIVGGKLLSGFKQGRRAAKMALRILKGESVRDVQLLKKSWGAYRFDYLELQRLGVDMAKLPRPRDLINRPDLLTAKYAWPLLCLFIISLVVVSAQAIRVHRARIRSTRLERDKEELDRQVEARTEDLKQINQKLRDEVEVRRLIEEELRDSNATKDKFFSIIAHDLKNPFCGLISLTEILKNDRGCLPEAERNSALAELHAQSKSTYQLLQDLLTWANLKQKNVPVAPEWLSLKNTIDECTALIRSNANAKQIQIENEVNENLSVKLDRFVLSTVTNNLCGNAVKFTPHGGHIRIQAEQGDQDLVIRVIDDGIGMDARQSEQIFDLSGTKSRPGTDNEAGTGLGLIICRELVIQTGGDIKAESQGEGKGTTFVVSFPQTSAHG